MRNDMKFQVHFFPYSANTLSVDYLGVHENGWTVIGDIHEDYYTWVNEFKATHPIFGEVYGDFEKIVYATSKKTYEEFIKHFPPKEWDYGDI